MNLETLLNQKLWAHQKEAVLHSRKYIETYNKLFRKNSNGENVTIGAALNRLPTGTGKSGIITVLTRCYADDCPVSYVVTPSEYLRDQLASDINDNFFTKALGLKKNKWPVDVIKVKPSQIEAALSKIQEGGTRVYVSTIQTLYDIFTNQNDFFNRLNEQVKLIMFDEGHREPAPEWANSVRAFDCPKLLFTATPYRNDKLKFEVNSAYVYAFTHSDALKGRYIRAVKFETFYEDSVEQFAKALIKYVDRLEKRKFKGKKSIPRVIVRCDNHVDIKEFADVFIKNGKTAIGIHHQFEKRNYDDKMPEYLQQKVPNLKERKKTLEKKHKDTWKDEFESETQQYWVHQYKLLEGLDEESFWVIANYAPMRNARMLIQQVGRVIRNTKRYRNTKAIYIERRGSRDSAFWDGYRRYEGQYEDIEYIESLYYNEIFDTYTHILPEYHYSGNRFRQKFYWMEMIDETDDDSAPDRQNHQYYEHLNYKLSCQVFEREPSEKSDAVLLEELSKKLVDEWISEKERDVRLMKAEHNLTHNAAIITYVKRNTSNALRDLYLFDFKVGYAILKITTHYIYFHDSSGGVFSELFESHQPVSPKDLKKLFGKDSKIKNVTLRNTDLGDYAYRRQNLSANLDNTVRELTDHMNFYSNATGEVQKHTLHNAQRYVSFSTARIMDKSNKGFDFDDYMIWLTSVNDILNSSRWKSKFFDRYAQFTPAPKKINPVNILIDFDEITGDFRLRENGEEIRFYDRCFEVEDASFQLKLFTQNEDDDGLTFEVKITYNGQKQKYELENKTLKKKLDYYENGQSEKHKHENLIRYLNREQCFRIIPEDKKLVYAYRQFYKPEFFPRDSSNSNLINTFVKVDQLKEIDTEKGKKDTDLVNNSWNEGSLFHFIDHLGEGSALNDYLGQVDLLFCDDAGRNETCDFIAVSLSSKKIIQIHCKAFSGSGKTKSATAFQDVLGQAIKNLSYLVLSNSAKPPNYGASWNEAWTVSHLKGQLGRLRVWEGKRVGMDHNIDKATIWQTMETVLRDPSSRRQVFVVMGNGFSLEAFENNLKHHNQDPVNIQIGYLVQNTWSNIRKVADSFKIFCH